MGVIGVLRGEDKVVGTWDFKTKCLPNVYIRETRLQNDESGTSWLKIRFSIFCLYKEQPEMRVAGASVSQRSWAVNVFVVSMAPKTKNKQMIRLIGHKKWFMNSPNYHVRQSTLNGERDLELNAPINTGNFNYSSFIFDRLLKG